MVAGSERHAHRPAPGSDARWLSAALALILAFMAGEVVAGLAAHSLALISDAAHMLTDAASIALVLITGRLAARPPAGGYTYGLKRTEILSAQANGITLVLLAAWLGYTAIRHLVTPPAVTGGTVLGVALAGVAVNVAATLLIARAGGGRGRADAIRGGRADQGLRTALPRGGAGWARPGSGGRGDGQPPARRRGPRPAHLGDHLGNARGLRARARRPGRGLPRGARRPRGLPEPGVRHHPRHPPGRPRRPAGRVRADPAEPGAALRRRARPGLPPGRRGPVNEHSNRSGSGAGPRPAAGRTSGRARSGTGRPGRRLPGPSPARPARW